MDPLSSDLQCSIFFKDEVIQKHSDVREIRIKLKIPKSLKDTGRINRTKITLFSGRNESFPFYNAVQR